MRRVAGLLILAILLAASIIPSINTSASSAPPRSEVEAAIARAENYINNLRVQVDWGYEAIGEYPALPLVVHDPTDGVWFVPGLKYGDYYVDFYYITTNYIDDSQTEFKWFMRLWKDNLVGDDLIALILVTEVDWMLYYSGWRDISIKVTFLNPNYQQFADARIYLDGAYIGLSLGEVNNEYIGTWGVTPSLRTTLRHVANLAPTIMYLPDVEALAIDTLNYLYQGNPPKPIYDIYHPLACGLGYITSSDIEEPNSDHFYDAAFFYGHNSGFIGYYIIYNYFDSNGWIWKQRPVYPYKSKLVVYTENTGRDGWVGLWWAMQILDDPLLDVWYGSYYACTGRYDKALEKWNDMYENWDGTGLHVTGQDAYSTVRLAAGIAFGTLLAKEGLIPWSVVDEMVNILLQLQWDGTGHYMDENGIVHTLVKTDHIGGFIVSYDDIASYGYVSFRPSLIEDILEITGDTMPDEYPAIVPTNAETTLVALAALKQYLQYRY